MELDDADLLAVIAVVMGETLASGSAIIEVIGQHIGMDMAPYWQADDAFFELSRDREVLTAMMAEVAGGPSPLPMRAKRPRCSRPSSGAISKARMGARSVRAGCRAG
jgi:hypothetical protein